MIWLAILARIFFPGTPANAQPALPSVYHDIPEIRQELYRLKDAAADLVTIDTIGYGGTHQNPIWLVKISDNPEAVEGEPALLYIGQVHAEEVTGIEIVLEIMRTLVENRDDENIRRQLENLELYFIPTLNPDGLQIVHENVDVTYRKNCRDNVGDGSFRFRRGLGRDSSGVDINRNFGLHWDRGDSLFLDNGLEDAFNYYRGPAPFSEPETQAIRDLMLRRKFLYSISYHSSRSGRNSELVIGPWNWDGKRPPGDDAIFSLATALADRIPCQEVNDNYFPARATMRVGQEQDWAYQATGCMMYMVEVGADIHPDSTDMISVRDANLPAAFYLMDLATGIAYPEGLGSITITVRDSTTGDPLPAEIWLGPQPPMILEPLSCDPLNGRFDRLLESDSYEVHVTCPGYQSFALDRCDIAANGSVEIDVWLASLPTYNHRFVTIDDSTGEALPVRVSVLSTRGDISEDFSVEGGFESRFPEGFQRLLFRAPDYIPQLVNLAVNSDTTDTIRMVRTDLRFEEDFDSVQNWQQGGMVYHWNLFEAEGRSCITESDTGAYNSNSNPWLRIDTGVRVEDHSRAVLELIHLPYFEPGEDYGWLEIYEPLTGRWLQLMAFSCFRPAEWDTVYIDLAGLSLSQDQLRLRFHITTDESVEEDGWLIDKLTLFYASPILATTPVTEPLPAQFSMTAFPSPTNGAITLLLTMPMQQSGRLALFNSVGREVRQVHEGIFPAGQIRMPIDISDLPSGTYFVEYHSKGLRQPERQATAFLLLK